MLSRLTNRSYFSGGYKFQQIANVTIQHRTNRFVMKKTVKV
ncbi:hypothetical protein [Desulfosporosinus fructosivorans]